MGLINTNPASLICFWNGMWLGGDEKAVARAVVRLDHVCAGRRRRGRIGRDARCNVGAQDGVCKKAQQIDCQKCYKSCYRIHNRKLIYISSISMSKTFRSRATLHNRNWQSDLDVHI